MPEVLALYIVGGVSPNGAMRHSFYAWATSHDEARELTERETDYVAVSCDMVDHQPPARYGQPYLED